MSMFVVVWVCLTPSCYTEDMFASKPIEQHSFGGLYIIVWQAFVDVIMGIHR